MLGQVVVGQPRRTRSRTVLVPRWLIVAGYHISTLNVRVLCESLSSMVTLPTPKVPIESGGDKEAGLSDVFVIEQPAKRNASARSVFGV